MRAELPLLYLSLREMREVNRGMDDLGQTAGEYWQLANEAVVMAGVLILFAIAMLYLILSIELLKLEL